MVVSRRSNTSLRWLATVLGIGVALLVTARHHLLVVTVNGFSMAPTYVDGDKLLVFRRRRRRRITKGDVVICRAPADYHRPLLSEQPADLKDLAKAFPKVAEVDPETIEMESWMTADVGRAGLLVKRVAALAGEAFPRGHGTVPEGHIFVLGDAPESFDSKAFGPIPEKEVVGVVIRNLLRRRRPEEG